MATLVQAFQNINKNQLYGFGWFGQMRADKKDESKQYLEIKQAGAGFTVQITDRDLQAKIKSLLSTKEIIEGQTIISYEAEVAILSEVKHISKGDNDYNWVGGRFNVPVLQAFEVITE